MNKRLALLLALAAMVAFGLATPAAAQSQAAAPVAGTDYDVIEGGQPYQAGTGVEIAEIFGYGCIHCAHFQPQVDAWKRSLPRHVRFRYVPAVFQQDDAFARAYFAAEASGALPRLHQALYDAVHVSQSLPANATVDELAAFFGRQGLDAGRMKAAMLAPSTDAQLARARAFAVRSQIEGTPSLIVAGRYRVHGRSAADRLRIASALAAREQAAR